MITYRDGTVADAEAIDRIFRTSFCDTFANLYAKADLDSFLATFTRDAWRAELGDAAFAFRVAAAAGEPFGYVKLGPLALPTEPAGPALELKQLYLLKDWHGRGAAQELMGWALAEGRARGARELYLSVYTENWRARRFYERYGFTVEGPYAFMVGNHADEDLIMKLAL